MIPTENELAIIEAIRAAPPHAIIKITKNGPGDFREYRIQMETSTFLTRTQDEK